jgi:penicillin-insensitive murein endopeptidase
VKRARILLGLSFAAFALWPPAARGDGAALSVTPARPTQAADIYSRSIGRPWHGFLVGGLRLGESANMRLLPAHVETGHFWGTAELVTVLEHAANRVAAEAPGARLTMGELGKRGRGNIPGHRSHESGRDADIGFYLVDAAGVSYEEERFLHVGRSGRVRHVEAELRFDDARNWLFVQSLLEDPTAYVKYLFIARSLKRRLLEEAARQLAPEELRLRAERVLQPPLGSHDAHDGHFHLRIYCPADDVPGCRERGPYYDWLPDDTPFLPEHIRLARGLPAREEGHARRRSSRR